MSGSSSAPASGSVDRASSENSAVFGNSQTESVNEDIKPVRIRILELDADCIENEPCGEVEFQFVCGHLARHEKSAGRVQIEEPRELSLASRAFRPQR